MISDNERVARVITFPGHLMKDGSGFKAGLFPPGHIRTGVLSLLRVDVVNSQELLVQATAIAENKVGEQLYGIAVAGTAALRAEKRGKGQAICVVDAPLPAIKAMPPLPAHAHAGASFKGELVQAEAEAMRIQKLLFDLFLEFVPVNEMKSIADAFCITEIPGSGSQLPDQTSGG